VVAVCRLKPKEDLKMSKSDKKPLAAASTTAAPTGKPTSQSASEPKTKKPDRTSKQSQVVAMLRSPKGATIVAMMKTTGWQQHSVRGFLAGVVRKRLKLRLDSKLVDGERVYRVAGLTKTNLAAFRAKRATR
jgi:uncharacterized protein DUF3489